MRQQFEEWYCKQYWDFKAVGRNLWDNESNSYNHLDVDLAWNAFKAGAEAQKKRDIEIAAKMANDLYANKFDVADAIERGEP